MSFGTVGPLLMLGFGAVIAVGIVLRLVRAARQGRTRAEFRSIGGAISGAATVQSSAAGWSPGTLAPMEGPTATPEEDGATGQVDGER